MHIKANGERRKAKVQIFPAGHQKLDYALIFGRRATLRVKDGESLLRM